MFNPFNEVKWHPDRRDLRSFAISLIVGFPSIAILFLAIAYLRGRALDVSFAAAIAGGGVVAGLLFLAIPRLARPVYVVWYFVACCVGAVVGNVLLAVIFYVLVTGIGILVRKTGRLSLHKEFDRSRSSYWLDVESAPEPERYYRQF